MFPCSSLEECTEVLATLGYTVTPVEDAPLRRSLCEGLHGLYSLSWHIGGTLLVLFASLFGVLLPFLTKYIECLRSNPYAFAVGKTAATGVLLSVSTVHLINEGIDALEEYCVPAWLTTYEAFAFLFALIAVLFMQALDLKLAEVAEEWARKKRERERNADTVVVIAGSDDTSERPSAHREGEEGRAYEGCANEAPLAVSPTRQQLLGVPKCENPEDHDKEEPHSHHHCHHHGGDEESDWHGHQHFIPLPPAELGSIRQVIAALCMEFGVALHSIFVGVAVGLTTDQELKPLMVALFFHQLFEGMAMGSRIVDANFHGKLELVLASIFVLSAPAGMAVAISVVSVSRDAMSGGWFVATMGILDAFCGGILLYLAFNLLFMDFPADMQRYCAKDQPHWYAKKVGLFVALWFGMLLMAGVGHWL